MTLQIISGDDDTWDDIDIEDNSFMYRTSRGIYTYYPDKDLLSACRTVLSPSFSDDDDTISTSASLQSVDDHDYPLSEMGDIGTPTDGVSSSYTTKMQPRSLLNLSASSSYSKLDSNYSDRNSTISRNNSLFDLIKDYEGRGTITRLGRTGRVHVDTGDWSQDLDVPSALKLSTKIGTSSNKAISQQTSTGLGGEGDEDHDPFADLQDDDDDDDGDDDDGDDDDGDDDDGDDDDGDDDDDDDDSFTGDSSATESSSQRRVRFDQVTTATRCGTDLEQQIHMGSTKTTTPLSLHQRKWKEEEDDEGFDDIDIPNDIGTRSVNPHHQHWPTNTTTATTTRTCSGHDNKTGYKASPLPPNIQKQLSRFKENDTDDFLDGLDIKEDIFKAPSSNSNNSSKKETLPLESKLPRPKRYQQQKSTASTIGQQTSSTSSSRKKPSPHENRWDRLTAPTYASRQRGTNTTPTTTSTFSPMMRTRPSNPHWDQTKPRTGPLSSLSRSHRLPSVPSHHTNKYRNTTSTSTTSVVHTSDGSMLVTKPRTGRINYGNGSELDHLDDLPVWKKPILAKPSRKITRFSDGPRTGSLGTVSSTRKPDTSSKSWRCNMSTRKLTLIKPEEQKVAKEINDMRYDERTRRWHGNEQATQAFDAPAKRRPALIKNMMTSRAAKSTSALVVGNMTFDQQKMSWNTHNGEEVDVLAHIDDLSENEPQQPHYHHRLRAAGMANHDQSGDSNPTIGSYYINHLQDQSRTTSSTSPSSSSFYLDSLSSPSRLYRNNDVSSTLNTSEKVTPVLPTSGSTDPTSIATFDYQYHQDRLGQNGALPSSRLHRSSAAGLREFDLPIDTRIQMTDQEEEHKAYFSAWPLRNEGETTEAPSGCSVPQNTYILY